MVRYEISVFFANGFGSRDHSVVHERKKICIFNFNSEFDDFECGKKTTYLLKPISSLPTKMFLPPKIELPQAAEISVILLIRLLLTNTDKISPSFNTKKNYSNLHFPFSQMLTKHCSFSNATSQRER